MRVAMNAFFRILIVYSRDLIFHFWLIFASQQAKLNRKDAHDIRHDKVDESDGKKKAHCWLENNKLQDPELIFVQLVQKDGVPDWFTS